MEKNEDSTEPVKEETPEAKPDEEKEASADEKEKSADDKDEAAAVKEDDVESKNAEDESLTKEDKEKETVDNSDKSKEDVKVDTDHSDKNGDTSTSTSTAATDSVSSNSNKSIPTYTTPTTTTSHLYSVLMAPLDGNSPYRDHALRYGIDDPDSGPRKRMRLDNSSTDKTKSEHTPESKDHSDTKSTADMNNSVGMDLTKNQKRKLKKKKRKHLLNRLEVQRAKDFIYSSENEQFSVEKLRTMIEDVTEFLDAIWDVYCSEARLKGESVEEDGSKVAAVLKCLSESGEGSWADLQLLSRAKSVLVLRSKNLAASTIARVENELGYDTDTRNFIVRMLKFWMGEIVTKG